MKFMIFSCLLCSTICAFELKILHASDINAEFEEKSDGTGGFPRLIHYVREKRGQADRGYGPPVVVVMTGNFFGASIWYSIHRWRIVADFLNLLKPDAIALGTREFNDGLDELYLFLTNLKFPVVGANLIVNQGLPLRNLIQKYTILHVAGKSIAVIGYTDRGYLTTKNVEFANSIKSLKTECEMIQRRSDIDYVIAIGHANYEHDRKIALISNCVHVVVGSNSKMFMYSGDPPSVEEPSSSYPAMVGLSDGTVVPVVHSYINGKYIGEVIVTFNDEKEVVKAEGNPVLLDKKIKQDKWGMALLEKYQDDLEKKKNHIIGKTLTSLDGNSCNNSECTLGNLITDAFCDFKASQYSGLYWTSTAIALINSGAIKATQNISKQGKLINEAFLYQSLPYQEQLTTIRVIGATLFKMLEHSMKQIGTNKFLQVSGLKISYNKTVSPPEMEVLVRCAKCEVPRYYPLNETLEYDIITTKYLAEGGDDYEMFAKKRITYRTEVINSLQATRRYLKDYKKIIEQKEERISIDSLESSGVKIRDAAIWVLMHVLCGSLF